MAITTTSGARLSATPGNPVYSGVRKSVTSQPLFSPASGYGTQVGNYYFVQTPSGGQWSTTPATPSPVLGASTTSTQTAPAPTPQTIPLSQSAGHTSNTTNLDEIMNSELAAQNTEFDRNLADLDAMLSGARSDKDLAIGNITTAQNQLLSDIGRQKEGVQSEGEGAVDTAASTARDTQRLNRNILRSLGILNSTYASDKLQEPNTLFQKAKADIGIQVRNRLGQLDDFVNNKKAEFVNQIKDIETKFSQIVDNINRDIRFTDRQRADALKAVNAAYAAKKAEVTQSTRGVIDAAQKAVQNFVASNLSAAIGTNPDLLSNTDALLAMKNNLSTAGSQIYGTPQQASIYEDPNKKKNLLSSTPTNYGMSTPTGPVYYNF